MKKLQEYVDGINEGRTPGAKNKPKNVDDLSLKDVKGLDAEENGSEGQWEIEPPTDDDLLHGMKNVDLTKNILRVSKRLSSKKPFFIQGEAGWGKTSIITDVAHKHGYTVITVYLDKCVPEDLGGLPAPERSRRSDRLYQTNLLPAWAQFMADNPNTKFLLFLDEMNQATTDVQNTLMPIILKNVIAGKKFHNFLPCAAGNLEEENRGGLTQLSKPLLSRFGGIILWESGDWTAAMKHLRKKYTDKVSAKMLDILDQCAPLFKNPRDVEQFILESAVNIKADEGNSQMYDAELYMDDIRPLLLIGPTEEDFKKLDRTDQESLNKLANEMVAFTQNLADKEEESGFNRKKASVKLMKPETYDLLIQGIKRGYLTQKDEKGVKYGVSKENIGKLNLDPDVITKEMWQSFLDGLEIDGIKFKYNTDAEWKKDGLKDPFDLVIGDNLYDALKDKKAPAKKRTIRDYANR